MHVTVIANKEDPEAGYVGEYLAELGATLHPIERGNLESQGSTVLGSDLVVLLGSDWSVHDQNFANEVRAEQAIVREIERSGIPLLGICYGAQLIASALGAAVERSPQSEIGWFTIASDDEQQCASGPWFQYHHDRIVLTDEITPIARTDIAPQAFWHGRTFAVQFHPEVQPAVIERWLRNSTNSVKKLGIDIDAVVAWSNTNDQAARTQCNVLVDRFLAKCAAPM